MFIGTLTVIYIILLLEFIIKISYKNNQYIFEYNGLLWIWFYSTDLKWFKIKKEKNDSSITINKS